MVKTTFIQEIADEPEVIVDKWDWNAIKNALDDSARKFLVAQPGFAESHRLMNGRLLISTIAIVFSGYALLHDWLHPFPESRNVLIACVLLYFACMGVLTIYTSYVEKGCFTAAKQTDKSDKSKSNRWKLSSKQKSRYDHVYVLEIELYDGTTKKTRTSTHEQTVARYFDENGLLLNKSLHNDMFKWFNAISEEKKSN